MPQYDRRRGLRTAVRAGEGANSENRTALVLFVALLLIAAATSSCQRTEHVYVHGHTGTMSPRFDPKAPHGVAQSSGPLLAVMP
jgi:hypothetical protein